MSAIIDKNNWFSRCKNMESSKYINQILLNITISQLIETETDVNTFTFECDLNMLYIEYRYELKGLYFYKILSMSINPKPFKWNVNSELLSGFQDAECGKLLHSEILDIYPSGFNQNDYRNVQLSLRLLGLAPLIKVIKVNVIFKYDASVVYGDTDSVIITFGEYFNGIPNEIWFRSNRISNRYIIYKTNNVSNCIIMQNQMYKDIVFQKSNVDKQLNSIKLNGWYKSGKCKYYQFSYVVFCIFFNFKF